MKLHPSRSGGVIFISERNAQKLPQSIQVEKGDRIEKENREVVPRVHDHYIIFLILYVCHQKEESLKKIKEWQNERNLENARISSSDRSDRLPIK